MPGLDSVCFFRDSCFSALVDVDFFFAVESSGPSSPFLLSSADSTMLHLWRHASRITHTHHASRCVQAARLTLPPGWAAAHCDLIPIKLRKMRRSTSNAERGGHQSNASLRTGLQVKSVISWCSTVQGSYSFWTATGGCERVHFNQPRDSTLNQTGSDGSNRRSRLQGLQRATTTVGCLKILL